MPDLRSPALALALTVLLATGMSDTASAQDPNRPIISEDFKGLDLTMPDGTHKKYPDPTKWGFTLWPGIKWPDSYGEGTNWLGGENAESQVYLTARRTKIKDQLIPAHLRYDPFSIKEDGLHITADLLTPQQQKAYHVEGHRRFGSGILLSRQTFTYGKIKVVAKLPSARGSWPAIWLLPARQQWPPEIDIMEGMAWGPHKSEIHSGFLTREEEKDTHPASGEWFDIGVDPSSGFHEYGLDWNKDTIKATFDGKTLWEKPTPPSMHQDMYLIINLAVGGSWAANELGLEPVDDISPERLNRAADLIQEDYPAAFVIKSVWVVP